MTAVRIRIGAGIVVALVLAVLPLIVRPAAPVASATGSGAGQVAAVGRSTLVCPSVGSTLGCHLERERRCLAGTAHASTRGEPRRADR